jgi:hypothetical protein
MIDHRNGIFKEKKKEMSLEMYDNYTNSLFKIVFEITTLPEEFKFT